MAKRKHIAAPPQSVSKDVSYWDDPRIGSYEKRFHRHCLNVGCGQSKTAITFSIDRDTSTKKKSESPVRFTMAEQLHKRKVKANAQDRS